MPPDELPLASVVEPEVLEVAAVVVGEVVVGDSEVLPLPSEVEPPLVLAEVLAEVLPALASVELAVSLSESVPPPIVSVQPVVANRQAAAMNVRFFNMVVLRRGLEKWHGRARCDRGRA